jgi:choline dehydrogenase-like flavoprotein
MHPKDSFRELHSDEIFFRHALQLTSLLYALAAIGYVTAGVQPGLLDLDPQPLPPMLTATLATKVVLLSVLASTAAGNIRRSRTPVYQLIAANLATVVLFVVLVLCGVLDHPKALMALPQFDPAIIERPGQWPELRILNYAALTHVPTRNLLGGSVTIDLVVCIVAYGLQRKVERVQYRFLQHLAPVEYDVIYALADVLIHDGTLNQKETISPADVANNVDRYLRKFPSQRTQSLHIAMRLMEYLPFRYNLTTFSYMNPADRRTTLERYFINRPASRWQITRVFTWFATEAIHWCLGVITAVVSPIKPLRDGWQEGQWAKEGLKLYAQTVVFPILGGIRWFINTLLKLVKHLAIWVYKVIEALLTLITPLLHAWKLLGRLVSWVVAFRQNFDELWLRLGRGLILSVKQLVYTGYYNDAQTQNALGYVPFPNRPDINLKSDDEKEHPVNLTVRYPGEVPSEELESDIVIVGTGAAAAIIAHHLVDVGLNVLMLERGPFIQPSELTGNEVEDSSRLYSDGLLQTSKNLELQIAQGRCVGGSTVVNNGICIDPPADELLVWKKELGDQLNIDQINAAVASVKALLPVQLQCCGVKLNPSASLFIDGLRQMTGNAANAKVVDANITNCLGCGYCNIGCRYGRKQDMLTRVLPDAQAMYSPGNGKGKLVIIEQCEAVRIRTEPTQDGRKATGIECSFDNGRYLQVHGRAYVISAGAIASSILLHRSELGGSMVGNRLSFNVAGVMTGRFKDPIHAYAGLQMSHYYRVPSDSNAKPEFMLETWFNPPTTQAMRMPGWFEDHFHNMEDYSHMMSIGALVGTNNNNQVTYLPARDSLSRIVRWIRDDKGTFLDFALTLMTQSNVAFRPEIEDIKKVIRGMVEAGKVMFAAGAEVVMPSTFPYLRFNNADELIAGLTAENIKPADLLLGSSHPQGGNALSESAEKGVVDYQFRVHGFDNLFVCDASVFPTSVGVNPQMTVMALARYAAEHHIAPITSHL